MVQKVLQTFDAIKNENLNAASFSQNVAVYSVTIGLIASVVTNRQL